MAHLVFIVGESGSGKSTSLRTLNPDKTVIINTDQKALPFRKYKEQYNEEKGNYLQTSNIQQVVKKMAEANQNQDIKTIIVDTWSRIMTDSVMSKEFRNAKNGMQAWANMAANQYKLINYINDTMRDDLIVYLFCHPESHYNDMGQVSQKIAVQGRQLGKLVPESFSSIVLYADAIKEPGKATHYRFKTQTDGTDTCKTPIDMFEDIYIDNDLTIVNEAILDYF